MAFSAQKPVTVFPHKIWPDGLNGKQKKTRGAGHASETARHWNFGFITDHRILVLLCMALSVLFLYRLQDVIWPEERIAFTWLEMLESTASVTWLGAVLPGACGLAGLLIHRHVRALHRVQPINQLVVFRIASRRHNGEALQNTTLRCGHEMRP